MRVGMRTIANRNALSPNLTHVKSTEHKTYDLRPYKLVLHTIFGHTKMTIQSDASFTDGQGWVPNTGQIAADPVTSRSC
jgi:hypothetical protein